MAGSLKWKGPEARARIRTLTAGLLKSAGALVQARAKELLSASGTGSAGRDGRGRYKKVYGAAPSAPGAPPAKQTGRLRASVSVEVDEASLTARVGTNVRYGRWLELGTRKTRARPWLRRALNEVRPAIAALFRRAGS